MSMDEVRALVGDLKEGIGGIKQAQGELDRRLGRVERGRPSGFVPDDMGEKATAGAAGHFYERAGRTRPPARVNRR